MHEELTKGTRFIGIGTNDLTLKSADQKHWHQLGAC